MKEIRFSGANRRADTFVAEISATFQERGGIGNQLLPLLPPSQPFRCGGAIVGFATSVVETDDESNERKEIPCPLDRGLGFRRIATIARLLFGARTRQVQLMDRLLGRLGIASQDLVHRVGERLDARLRRPCRHTKDEIESIRQRLGVLTMVGGATKLSSCNRL